MDAIQGWHITRPKRAHYFEEDKTACGKRLKLGAAPVPFDVAQDLGKVELCEDCKVGLGGRALR